MSVGTPRHRRPARPTCGSRATTPCNGGYIFAEDPGRAAPEARIIWRADLDPGTLSVQAQPVEPADPDHINLDRLRQWLTVCVDGDGREHAVLSDGLRHIRMDCDRGSLCGATSVLLRYRLQGTVSAEPLILPLRRFLYLHRYGRFSPKLFPADGRIDRWLTVLRVHDAARAGASHREIAEVLFGRERVPSGRAWKSEALNARVDRLAGEAHRMAAGAYRSLLVHVHRPRAGETGSR